MACGVGAVGSTVKLHGYVLQRHLGLLDKRLTRRGIRSLRNITGASSHPTSYVPLKPACTSELVLIGTYLILVSFSPDCVDLICTGTSRSFITAPRNKARDCGLGTVTKLDILGVIQYIVMAALSTVHCSYN